MPITRPKMMIRHLFLILFVGQVNYACGWLFDEQKSIQQAESHQAAGKHNVAIIELKKVLKHNSTNKHARVLLAKSYLEMGQAASAEKELSFARKLGVPLSDLADLWGRTLLLQKEYKRIFEEVPLSLATSPQQKAGLMLVHGYANASLNNKSAAYELFQKVKGSRLLPVEVNIALSLYAMNERDMDTALGLINEAIAIEGNNLTAWLQKGQILLAKQDTEEARNAFEKVVELSAERRVIAKEFEARVHLVQIALTQENLPLAREKVGLLIDMAPNQPLSLYLSAVVDYQEKKYQPAQASLEKVLAKVPNDLRSILLLGAVHFAQNSLEQANKYLSRFVENVPTHIQARKLLAAVRMKLGQHRDALEALTPIEGSASDTALLAMIGRASMLNNNPAQAEAYYKRAKSSNPENQLLKRELANVYLRRGSIDEAIEELESITGESQADAKKMLVYAHLRKQDFTAARRVAKDMLQTEGNAPAGYSVAGLVELSAGDRLKAREYFNKSLQISPEYIPGLVLLARMDYEDGILDSAKAGFEKVLEIDEQNVNAMMGLSALAGRENNTEQSIRWLLLAKEKNPAALAPTMVLSQYYLKTGQAREAVSLLSEYVKIAKNDPAVKPVLITAQLQAGQKDAALLTASEFVKNRPSDAVAHLLMAQVQQALGKEQDAEKSLARSLEINPGFVQANIAMATLYVKQGKYESAHQIADRLKKNYPKQAVGFMLEGEIFLVQEKFTRAIKTFSDVYKRYPQSGPVRKLSVAYRRAGKSSDAIRVLDEWVKRNPRDTSARLDLALNYEKTNQIQQARSEYHSILEQTPQNVAVLNNIALAYLDIDTSKALEYAERAYKLKPEIAAIADTLGWILLATGDTGRAMTLLASASGKSRDPSIQYHYAVGLKQTGSEEQARQVLRQLLNTPLDFPEKAQAEQLLGSLSSKAK